LGNRPARHTRSGEREFLADRAHIGELFLGKYLIWKSSGSSGETGIYVQDRAALSVYDSLLAVQMQSARVATRYALGLFAQAAAQHSSSRPETISRASRPWQRVCRGTPWPNARAFSVTEAMPALVAQLNVYQPAFLASYPTTLALLAAERNAGRLEISPACIWSGGEYLSETSRAAIERAFGAVLINEYGASECMSIAHSCVEGCLHVSGDWVVLDRSIEIIGPRRWRAFAHRTADESRQPDSTDHPLRSWRQHHCEPQPVRLREPASGNPRRGQARRRPVAAYARWPVGVARARSPSRRWRRRPPATLASKLSSPDPIASRCGSR
jgi:hypothetical protein